MSTEKSEQQISCTYMGGGGGGKGEGGGREEEREREREREKQLIFLLGIAGWLLFTEVVEARFMRGIEKFAAVPADP